MAFFTRLQTRLQSWWQDTPLPATDTSASPAFQLWHEFDEDSKQWHPVESSSSPPKSPDRPDVAHSDSQLLRLVTWNVDSTSPLPGHRIEAILSCIFGLSPAADIIFLQELGRPAIAHILDSPRVRQGWFLSDPNGAIPNGQSFASMTMLSKARFQRPHDNAKTSTLGPVWRVKYPSRFGRDALCCDVFIPSSSSSEISSRVRLINVHLDSLPIQPSSRPQQITIATSYLRSAGRGIVAGDFNPVLPEDATLLEDNGLVDAWAELKPDEPGFTWGIDGKQPFPPNRMDKIAAFGLRLQGVDIHHPGTAEDTAAGGQDGGQEHCATEGVAWSDHSGLSCTFRQVG